MNGLLFMLMLIFVVLFYIACILTHISNRIDGIVEDDEIEVKT